MDPDGLNGRRILVVEDEYLAAEDLVDALQEMGAVVVGPVADIISALGLIDRTPALDGAVLDINLGGDFVFPVADRLASCGIPFAFSTGYDQSVVPREHQTVPLCEKPVDTDQVLSTLASRLHTPSPEHHSSSTGTDRSRSTLLQLMPAEVRDAMVPRLRRVELARDEIIVREGELIRAIFFSETAVVSILAANPRSLEVGMVGLEGVTDFPLHDGACAVLRSIVCIPGTAWRMEASDFLKAIETASAKNFMLAYSEARAVQFAYAALAHGVFTIDARLARWILMAADRSDGESIPIVHDRIATALGVRRSGITNAMHVLEGIGAIKSLRGRIIIRDRTLLERQAGGAYGLSEAAYDRIMGAPS